MIDNQYQGDGYEISITTVFGRVLVHVTRSACEVLSAGQGSSLSVIEANSDVIAAMVHHLVTDSRQMRVRIDGSDVTQFLVSRTEHSAGAQSKRTPRGAKRNGAPGCDALVPHHWKLLN